MAWAIPELTAQELVVLHPGVSAARGNAALIAPGTGSAKPACTGSAAG